MSECSAYRSVLMNGGQRGRMCCLRINHRSCAAYGRIIVPEASHFQRLDLSLQLCIEGPGFASVQEDGKDQRTLKSYLVHECDVLVLPQGL